MITTTDERQTFMGVDPYGDYYIVPESLRAEWNAWVQWDDDERGRVMSDEEDVAWGDLFAPYRVDKS
jgi:hypothetical protein